MGQEDIIICLKKLKKPLSRSDIAKQTGINPIHVSHLLNKLLKHKEIKCMEIDRHQATKFYNVKRRMLLYYI